MKHNQHERRPKRIEAVAHARQQSRAREPSLKRGRHLIRHRAGRHDQGTHGVGSTNSIGTNTSCVGAVHELPTGYCTRAAIR